MVTKIDIGVLKYITINLLKIITSGLIEIKVRYCKQGDNAYIDVKDLLKIL